MTFGMPKIDTLNGGQTCVQCRNFLERAVRHDRFWGDVPVTSYCKQFGKVVIPSDGQECRAFLKKPFTTEEKKV